MSLEIKIERAFRARDCPSSLIERRAAIICDDEDALWFYGRKWQEISLDDWRAHSGAFFAFTAEAFLYYLPSVLTLSAGGRCDLLAASSLIGMLDRMPEPAYWDEFLLKRMSGLNQEEYGVIMEWLLSLSGTAMYEEVSLMRAYQTVDLLATGRPA